MVLWVQAGWVFKALVYAIIGGVACQSAVQGVSKVNGADVSPQVSTVVVGDNCGEYSSLYCEM